MVSYCGWFRTFTIHMSLHNLVKLNFPEAELKIRQLESTAEIFDPLRKRYVRLTAEEWVRQHLINYFHHHLGVPVHMMASERGLIINKLQKRFDLVIYHPGGYPLLIAECKAPTVKLGEDTFYQAAGYNFALKVKFLMITNGIEHHCVLVEEKSGQIRFLEAIPDYDFMKRYCTDNP